MRHDNEVLQSFNDVVADYRANHLHNATSEMAWYAERPISLLEATRRAALSRIPSGRGGRQIRHPHQRRIPANVLEEVASCLVSREVEFLSITNFAEVFEIVRSTISSIRGVGDLLVYDISHRIGGYLKREPTNVYLHAGTKRGAKALGLDSRREYINMAELPPALRKLSAAQIEDVLCIYASSLIRIRASEHG